jgi:predicted nucleic acid-binding protein
MADALTRLVVDCSVVGKWHIPTEDHAAAAAALFGDWKHHVVDVSVPNHFPSEVISAFLRVSRRGCLTTDEAREAIRDLLALPFVFCDVTALADRAFTIAHQHQQRAYDCLYVAPAALEGIELWTSDEHLYNALPVQHPLVRWIADYQQRWSGEPETATQHPEVWRSIPSLPHHPVMCYSDRSLRKHPLLVQRIICTTTPSASVQKLDPSAARR